jgi:glycerol uptake operon antiterminator
MLLHEKTVIPSVKDLKYLEQACESKSPVVFLTKSNIANLQCLVKTIHDFHKRAFVHIDLIGGFKPDDEGIHLLHSMYHLDGVVSTNIRALSEAYSIGLQTVYRVFLIDSKSLERAGMILKKARFTALEVLPGEYALKQEKYIRKYVKDSELIAGGFIRDQKLIDKILSTSFIGLDTSDSSLWPSGCDE